MRGSDRDRGEVERDIEVEMVRTEVDVEKGCLCGKSCEPWEQVMLGRVSKLNLEFSFNFSENYRCLRSYLVCSTFYIGSKIIVHYYVSSVQNIFSDTKRRKTKKSLNRNEYSKYAYPIQLSEQMSCDNVDTDKVLVLDVRSSYVYANPHSETGPWSSRDRGTSLYLELALLVVVLLRRRHLGGACVMSTK